VTFALERLADRDSLLSVSAGWHAHLDILADFKAPQARRIAECRTRVSVSLGRHATRLVSAR
jgi:hypothetical protein